MHAKETNFISFYFYCEGINVYLPPLSLQSMQPGFALIGRLMIALPNTDPCS